jgi:hypothetical protein
VLESLVMTPSSGEQKGNRRECKSRCLRSGPILSIRPMHVQLVLLALTITGELMAGRGTCPCGSGKKIEHNLLTGAWRKREEAFSLPSCRYDDRAHTYGLLSDTMTSCCKSA